MIQMDEMWSYVGSKANKHAHLACNRRYNQRNCWGTYWRSPSANQQNNYGNRYHLSIDNVQCVTQIFGKPMNRFYPINDTEHCPCESGKTSYIERFNNTLRQRVGRLVRKTLSFSKVLDNHIGAIWYFIHHYNASLKN
jgi:IS1 family transposase